MGKRKQSSNIPVPEMGQLDVVETEGPTDVKKNRCQHVAKAVEINHVKKSLKSQNLKTLFCAVCSKSGQLPKEENWICLQCGARLCSLEHLKNHFNIPRSDLHAVAFSIYNFTVWCHSCNSLVEEEENKKLKVCTGYIKQTMEQTKQVQIDETPYNDDIPPPLVELNESNEAERSKSSSLNKQNNYYCRPSVKGLINLGNTCFFNSVLQCLARTPKLVETLRRMETEKEHVSITLKNGQRLEGVLERSGDFLGQCLADTLVSLSTYSNNTVENPLKVLELLRKKCPQFEGYDQHDSHELLRHLLDNVRQNDLKRYRSLMLSELGLSRKSNPQDVSPELQKKVKALDNEVMERVTLFPEHVFKGLLVSTLKCQECRNTSQCVESFLDLSLPIMADKPQPPSVVRRKGSASPELVDEKVGGGMSKYQMKKQPKPARKYVRNKHGCKSSVAAADGSLPASVDSQSYKGDSEGDVEDNEEDKPHESGYSSEKIQSESSSLSGGDDSARTSPTTHVKDERVNSDAKLLICEGLPTVGGCSSTQSSGLVPQPQCTPFPRVRRRPCGRWIGVGGSLTPTWVPNNDTICVPDPSQVMEGGESWKNYAPRNGESPTSGTEKNDPALNPIEEEMDRLKVSGNVNTDATSVSDQVSLMNKVVETMLAQVHICQKDLNRSISACGDSPVDGGNNPNSRLYDKYECNQVDGNCNSDKSESVSNKLPRFNPFDSVEIKENSPTDDRISTDSPLNCNNAEVKQDCLSTSKEVNSFNNSTITENKYLNMNIEGVDNVERECRKQNSVDYKEFVEARLTEVMAVIKEQSSDNFQNQEVEPSGTASDGKSISNQLINECYDKIKSENNKCADSEEEKKETNNEKDNNYLTPLPPNVENKTGNPDKSEESQNFNSNLKSKSVDESDEKEETLDIPPILSDTVKTDDNRKEEKKEESVTDYRAGCLRTRTKCNDRDIVSRSQDHDSECSVQSCLSQFTAVEIMSGANRVGCSVCTQRQNKGNKDRKTVYTIASKQLLIKGAPDVLILHLKRFQAQTYSFKKLSKHVSFPLNLDLAPFCLQEVERDEEGKINYSLYGVVEHSGNLNGGHYVAYIKVEDEENSCKWFYISDSYVNQVTVNRVLQSQAYLLFYKRKNPEIQAVDSSS